MGSIVRPLLVLSVAHVCSCWHSRPAPRHRRLPLRSQSDQHPTPTTWNYDHNKDGEACWVPTLLSSSSLVSTETYRWCTNFVLPLNLCPWAAGSIQTEGAIHIFVVRDATEMASAVYEAAVRLLDTVEGDDDKVNARYAINFVVCDTHDWTFEEFNGWFEDLEEAFWDDPVVGESVTLAPFHPDWRFDSGNNDNGETQQDAVAFEKKSPYPTVTIVCTSVIDQAGEAVTLQIANHNEDRLLQEGTTRLQKLYEKNVLLDRSTEDPS